jgi:hypothetical protein
MLFSMLLTPSTFPRLIRRHQYHWHSQGVMFPNSHFVFLENNVTKIMSDTLVRRINFIEKSKSSINDIEFMPFCRVLSCLKIYEKVMSRKFATVSTVDMLVTCRSGQIISSIKLSPPVIGCFCCQHLILTRW